MTVPLTATLEHLGAAALAGLLIGLERGWSARKEPAGSRVAGLRTYGLIGALGGICALIPPMLAAVAMAATALVVLAGYVEQLIAGVSRSATSAIAALLVLLFGFLAGLGQIVEALAGAAAVTLLLTMRHTLHGWLRGMSQAEEHAAARFAVLALVVLPLTPDRALGPLGAWNPRQLWLVVVLVSGLSFLGYVAARRTAPARGLFVTALFGAIVSSTAVTTAFSRRLASGDAAERALIGGIALAAVIMGLRMLLLIGLLAPFALPDLAVILGPALLPGLLVFALSLRRGDNAPRGEVKLGNPLELTTALGFGLLLALLALASRWVLQRLGGIGVAGVLAFTGLADVDAAVLTFAGLPRGTLAPRVAALALAGPMVLNTLLRAAICVVLAPGRAGLKAAAPLLATAGIAIGAAALTAL